MLHLSFCVSDHSNIKQENTERKYAKGGARSFWFFIAMLLSFLVSLFIAALNYLLFSACLLIGSSLAEKHALASCILNRVPRCHPRRNRKRLCCRKKRRIASRMMRKSPCSKWIIVCFCIIFGCLHLENASPVDILYLSQVKYFLLSAPVDWQPDQLIRRFLLPTGDYVSCILWLVMDPRELANLRNEEAEADFKCAPTGVIYFISRVPTSFAALRSDFRRLVVP